MMAGDIDTVGLKFPGPKYSDVAFVKVMLQIDPKFVGHKLRVQGRSLDGAKALRTTYAISSVDPRIVDPEQQLRAVVDSAQTDAKLTIPGDRSGGVDSWVDLPGQFVFDAPGCYQAWVDIDQSRYGPFGIWVRGSE